MQRWFPRGIGSANFVLYLALFTPILVTLLLRIRSLNLDDPARSLSLVVGTGSALGLICGPLFGRLSDRTTSRTGRRNASSRAKHCATSRGGIGQFAGGQPNSAVRGTRSAGTSRTGELRGQVERSAKYRKARTFAAQRDASQLLGQSNAISGFRVGLDEPVLRDAGAHGADGFNVMMLGDRIGIPESQLAAAAFTALACNMLAAIIASYLGGYLSDKTGRRKIFLVAAGVIIALGLTTIAVADTFSAVLLGNVIGGGDFFAVHMTLIVQVLLSAESNGKDMGIVGLASSLPQTLTPAVAPVLLGLGGYAVLYMFAALVVIAGSLLVTRVHGVR